MKVTILRSTLADGGKDFGPGDTPDLPDSDALVLISVGAAERFTAPEKPEKSSPETAEAKHAGKETAAKK